MQEGILSPLELSEHLRTNEPKLFFSNQVATQTEQILRGIRDQAVRRRNVDGITIDGSTTLDADDAVWVEKFRGGHRVYVSITDVTEAIEVFSPLDLEALMRSTSLYRENGVIPMLPFDLSNERYSLNGKRKHISITVEFDIDKNGRVTRFDIYESLLTHRGKFTHDEFSEGVKTRGYRQHSQFVELETVANRIRNQKGFDLGEEGIQENASSPLMLLSGEGMNVHRVIEVLMVTTNQIVAQVLKGSGAGIFRQHHDLRERAFYTLNPGRHEGLRIKKTGAYTHFTSPLRRYPDVIVHRLLKALIRKQGYELTPEHIEVMIDYINRRIFEVDILNAYYDHEAKGKRSVERVRKNFDRDPATHDFKQQLRLTLGKTYELPSELRKYILADLENPDSNMWHWAVGIIILGNDRTIKESLRKQVLENGAMAPLSFLNSLAQTRIVLGGPIVFDFRQKINAEKITAQVRLPDGHVLQVTKKYWHRHEATRIQGIVRRELIGKIFDYYLK